MARTAYFMNENRTSSIPKSKPARPPRIVFGLMSAVAKLPTVEQLVDALAPYPVVIHHDFTQQPDFAIEAENACFVPNPKRTGYGVWGFTEGLIRLLQYCAEQIDFDYIQLVSPACLPIKPLAEFERHLTETQDDYHMDFMDPSTDRDVMMAFGPRCYAPYKSLRQKLLGRASRWYIGSDPRLEEIAGVQLLRGPKTIWKRPGAIVGYLIMEVARLGLMDRYAPAPEMRPLIGGAWIGASRPVCEYLVKRLTEPAIYEHFRRYNDIGEISIATVLGNSHFRGGAFNTFVNTYNDWSPRMFDEEDLNRLEATRHFFARKFPDDATAPVRLRVIERIKAGKALS